jgi:Trypsin
MRPVSNVLRIYWNGRRAHAGHARAIAFNTARALLAASVLVACGDSPGELTLSQLSRVQQSLIGGEVDPDHPEVMLLASQGGSLCTGTVIHVDGSTGFLLTAAQCVTEEDDEGSVVPLPARQFIVVPGVDVAKPTTAFSVKAVSVEPDYDGSFATDDIAVVRFSLGNAPAPTVIPVLASSEDQLGVDDELLLIGYGQTETGDENALRRRVERNVEALDEQVVAYTREDGKGACVGDRGGPGLVRIGGEERVAVVISGGVDEDDNCAGGFGVALRVSAYESFLESVLVGGSSH